MPTSSGGGGESGRAREKKTAIDGEQQVEEYTIERGR